MTAIEYIPTTVTATSFRAMGEAATAAAGAIHRLSAALREARERRERDAFWNHPAPAEETT